MIIQLNNAAFNNKLPKVGDCVRYSEKDWCVYGIIKSIESNKIWGQFAKSVSLAQEMNLDPEKKYQTYLSYEDWAYGGEVIR